MLLLLEAYESIKLIEAALAELPAGEWRGEMPEALPKGQASATAEGPAWTDSLYSGRGWRAIEACADRYAAPARPAADAYIARPGHAR